MRRALLILAALALLVGCTGEAAIPQAQAQAEIEAARKNMARGHAVWEVSISDGPVRGPFLAEVWRGGPDLLRVEVLEAPTPALRGLLLVRNGGTAWLYDRYRRRVEWGDAEQARLPLLQDALEEVERLLATAGEARITSARREWSAEGELTRAELLYPTGTRATLRLDPARLLLRRISYLDADAGQTELSARTWEIPPNLSDRLFTFETPGGVETVRLGGYEPRRLTLEEARLAAGFPLLLPGDLPPGVAPDAAYQLEEVIAISYGGALTFTLAQGPGLDLTLPLSRSVPLRSTQGYMGVSGGGVTLFWQEGGVPRSLSGKLSAEEALSLAESLR